MPGILRVTAKDAGPGTASLSGQDCLCGGVIPDCRTVYEVEYATLEWGDWFNNSRLLEPIGNIPPAELALAYYHQLEESAMVV